MLLSENIDDEQWDDNNGQGGAGFSEIHAAFAFEVVERDGERGIVGTEKCQCESELIPHRQKVEDNNGCEGGAGKREGDEAEDIPCVATVDAGSIQQFVGNG